MITIADHFVLRVGGLSPRRLRALNCRMAYRHCTRLFRLERSLGVESARLVDLLYAEIRRAFDEGHPDAARRLLRLKRAAHNQRDIATDIVDSDALGSLSTETRRQVRRWLAISRQMERRRIAARRAFADEMDAARRGLRALIRDTPAFQNALLIASRSLYDNVQHYLVTPSDAATNRVRRAEQSALAYLFRMATRTTPFASFVSVGAGRWTASGPETLEIDRVERRSVVRPALHLLMVILDALGRHPDVRPFIPVRLNRTLRMSPSRIEFLRRAAPTSGDDPTNLSESWVSMKRSAALNALLSVACGNDGAPLCYRDLLTALTPSGTAEDVREAARRFLDRLVDEQLVETGMGIPEQAPDPLTSVRAMLARFDAPIVRDIRRGLDAVSANLDRYPSLSTARRAEVADTVFQTFADLHTKLDRTLDPSLAPGLYEDSVVGDDLVLPQAMRAPLRDGFRAVGFIAPAFDSRLIDQERVSALFTERYGEGGVCSDILEFWTLFRERQKTQTRSPKSPLGAIQRSVNQRLAESYSAAAGAGATEWQIDVAAVREDVDRLWAHYPPHARAHDCLIQMCRENGARRVVLNSILPGWGKFFSRFCWFVGGDELIGSMRDFVTTHLAPSGIPCDIVGSFAHNVNARPQITEYEIDYPATLSDRPPTARIALDDIALRHDPRCGAVRLYSKRLEREIVPLHLGFLAETWVPPFCRFLLMFGPGQGVLSFEGGLFDTACKTHAARFDRGGIAFFPRIVAGDLIVRRACWIVGREDMPSLDDKSEFDLYRDLCRWWTEKGLPRVCRIEPDYLMKSARPVAAADRQVTHAPRQWKRLDQGQFFDVESYFAVSLLVRLLRSSERPICVEEMVPELDDATVRVGQDGEPHVAEIVVGLTYPPAGS